MQFTISREALIRPLQRVAAIAGSGEKKQTLPILSNILVTVKNQLLSLTGTDLEIEMIARIPLAVAANPGSITLPGKKLIDICKTLPENSSILFELNDNKITLRSGRSRYVLAALGAENFPRIGDSVAEIEFSLSQPVLRQLLDSTCFAMAHQDVRYYLNGMCFILQGQELRIVASDGHRLATVAHPLRVASPTPLSIIIPRKAILEMQRLFAEGEEEIGIVIGKNHLRAVTNNVSFITKLIEGKYPDYRRVLPQYEAGNHMRVSRDLLRQALQRVSALFTDKYRGVGLQFSPNLLKIVAVTPEKDEVEDEIEVEYQGPSLEIGVNSTYLIEYLQIIRSEMVKVTFMGMDQVVLFEAQDVVPGALLGQHAYVVMPMRL